jgi:hypothetical protein
LPTVNGFALVPVAQAAKGDVNIAYLAAAGLSLNVEGISVVNIGGLTFTPGLYKTNGGLGVSSGTLTLNGTGVYIFQIATTLEVG